MAEIEIDGVNLTTEQIQDIIKERDTAKASVNSTVEEIKSMRKTKQELESAKADLEKKLTEASTNTQQPGDIDKIVTQKLTEQLTQREQLVAKAEEDKAMVEFISAHPEFSEDTDKTGLRMETFKRELSRFNLSGAKSKDDFLAVMKDAVTLLYRKENKEYTSPFASSPSSGGGNPVQSSDSGMTPEEKETMKRLGWDVKKFNEMKIKHPDLYESVFKK